TLHVPNDFRLQSGGQTYACFDVPGYKLLLEMDAALAEVTKIKSVLETELIQKNEQIDNLNKVVQIQENSIQALKANNDRLSEQWKQENLKRLQAENVPKIGGAVGWIIAGVLAATSAVLLTVVLVK